MAMTSRGTGGKVCGSGSCPPVRVHVARTGAGEQSFATPQLGRQRGQRSGGELPVEVRDHADDVRQPRAVTERRSALVVHEEERHLVGSVRQGQRADQRLKQLRLPGTRGPGDQRMRAVDRQVDRQRSGRRHPESPRASTPSVVANATSTRCGVDPTDEVEQAYRGRKLGRRSHRGTRQLPQRRERTGHAVDPRARWADRDERARGSALAREGRAISAPASAPHHSAGGAAEMS